MTDQRNFKRLVRDRMDRTGERYAAARAQVLAAAASADDPETGPTGLFGTVTTIGGQQPDLAAARNLCTSAGVRGPDGSPLTEAMAFGLAGGIGFLYGVFTYDAGPTMTIVARHESMPDPFIEPLFSRVGVEVDVAITGGAKRAAAALDRALATGQPSLATVGAGALKYLGESAAMASMAPHIVGVVGVGANDEVLVDDRSPNPISVDRAEFDAARAAYKKAKHRLLTVTSVADDHDWSAAVVDAIRRAPEAYDEPPVPQFAANVGLAGLKKFQRLLTDPAATKQAKGWPHIFAEGRTAAIGLSRLHDCIDYAYTAPSAGRALYADFLDEAINLIEGPAGERLAEAAGHLRQSGVAWSAIVSTIVEAHEDLARYASLAAERARVLDEGLAPATTAGLAHEQSKLVASCTIDRVTALDAFTTIADHVGDLIDEEEAALEALRAVA